MRYVLRLLYAILFVALFLFSVKNTDSVSLHFYFDGVWQAPLVVVLLVFFAAGAALGVLACLAKLFSYRRELVKLRRELRIRGHNEGHARNGPAGDAGTDSLPGI